MKNNGLAGKIEWQIVWTCADGQKRPSAGVWSSLEVAEDIAKCGVRENISPSTVYEIIPVVFPNIARYDHTTQSTYFPSHRLV